MNEVERLNYVNGRRLQAGDFKLEQDYLIEMRRRLNRGLFTPGVVNGCGVRQVQGSATKVEVDCGLVLDPKGREMVLTSRRELSVPSQPPVTRLKGYFLVMTYAEEALTGEDPDCGPPIREAARVREQPELRWTETLPSHAHCDSGVGTPLDCGVVLALVSLKDCEITLVDTSLRQLANPTHSSQATAYALEGEKDIDADNPKVLHFQVRGGTPSTVTLYLWADRFSSLHYTQMGEHEHVLKAGTLPLSKDTTTFPEHTHTIADHTHRPQGTNVAGNLETLDADFSHGHRVLMGHPGVDVSNTAVPYVSVATHRLNWSEVEYAAQSAHVGAPPIIPRPYIEPSLPRKLQLHLALGGRVNFDGTPSAAQTGGLAAPIAAHTHSHALEADVTLSPTGSHEERAGNEPAYRYFRGLSVEFDGADITAEILRPLSSFGNLLGNGTDAHDLVKHGTDAIDLLDAARSVGKVIDAGPHTLTFRLAEQPGPHPGNGGKLLYNLFVE